MIENIRKYRGLLIIFVCVAGLALVLGIKDDAFRRGGGGVSMYRIDGRTYGDLDYQKLGQNSAELAQALWSAGDIELMQFAMMLSSGAKGRDDAPRRFFVNRMLLRNAFGEFGIRPGEEEISAKIRTMSAFSDEAGKFNPEVYRNFTGRFIGRLGLTEADLRALVSDVLAMAKLRELISGGLAPNRAVVSKASALANQQVSGEIARIDLDSYGKSLNPSDDELKKYWEVIQDSFRTELKRKFSYVLVTPDLPAEKSEPDAGLPASATEEQKKQFAAEQAKKTAERAEARRAKQLATDEATDNFVFELEQKKGADFEGIAKKNGWEVKTTELFSAANPPADLVLNLRNSAEGGRVVPELFKMQITSDPLSKISQAFPVGENQWLIARLDGEEVPRAKTYEEAKTEARTGWIAEKATEAMTNAANEAAAKIKVAIAAGKSFADAAKEAGIPAVSPFTNVSAFSPHDPALPRTLFESVRHLDPSTIAGPVIEKDRAFIIRLGKREVVKDTQPGGRTEAEITKAASQIETAAFLAWLDARNTAAKVEELFNR